MFIAMFTLSKSELIAKSACSLIVIPRLIPAISITEFLTEKDKAHFERAKFYLGVILSYHIGVVISYIGYTPQQVKFNGTPLTITLKEDAKALDEVVVMGYGVAQKRTKVTNSIAKVSEKTLTVGANANPAQALAGAVSGVKVDITSGSPAATDGSLHLSPVPSPAARSLCAGSGQRVWR